jgi:SpoVK/Ycf46/Vps4 family AAA+-type ATPase
MGVTPPEVEQNLGQFLKLGELWGAIVLLDEADIYLEQRDTENLQRNALVSVFLRALEYYKGILFLTTNRVGSFDEAFISRIHVPLYYKDLTDDDRRQIWENSFERLEGDKTRLKPIEIPNSTSSFAAEGIDVKWNGREIRNGAFSSINYNDDELTTS